MMMTTNTATKAWEDDDTNVMVDTTSSYQLIVWNDEVNSFDWVIETLVDICGHTQVQAEQCAMIIHFKGKYAVKDGHYDSLKPMREAITERGINATIEMVVNQ